MIKTNLKVLQLIEKIARDTANVILKTFKKGEYIVQQNEKPKIVYIIKKGITKCFITEENGKDYVLDFSSAGEIIGEVELLTHKDQYFSTIEALTILEVYVIPKVVFDQLNNEDNDFNMLIKEVLAHRLMNTSKRSSYQQIYPLLYSVLKIIYDFGQLDEHISKQDLANYLGITVRSLNRTLQELVDKKIITINEVDNFEIKNAPLLIKTIEQFY